MDMIKTLLIYLSATMALSVQGAEAPRETPAPTSAPQAVVETVETAVVSADPGGSAPAAQMTAVPPEKLAEVSASSGAALTAAPVPTITPNAKYRTLSMRSRGKEVRALQERLIELGYLPAGSADGAYGRQTYNAVKRFQQINGLKVDGVAGRATQTYLYENPDVVPYSTESVETSAPTPTPTAAPTPTAVPTNTPVPTDTPTPEPTDTPAPTDQPLPKWAAALAPEETPVPTDTPTPAPTETPTKVPGTPTPTPIPILTAAPDEAETAKQAQAPMLTNAPEEDLPEIIENVDLDADVYEPLTGIVALNEGGGPLEFVAIEDGVPVTARPRLRQCGAKIRVSLDDLCRCEESWVLTDDGLGTLVLEAAGYTLAISSEDQGLFASVNGNEIPIREDDVDLVSEGHFINAEFLAGALKGEAEWIPEESTLMLRIRDREAAEAAD